MTAEFVRSRFERLADSPMSYAAIWALSLLVTCGCAAVVIAIM